MSKIINVVNVILFGYFCIAYFLGQYTPSYWFIGVCFGLLALHNLEDLIN